jgi:hypothetical protein
MNSDDELDAAMREVMELIGERCDFAHWIDDYFDDVDPDEINAG